MSVGAGSDLFYVFLISMSFFPNGLVVVAFIHSRAQMAFKERFLVSLAIADLCRAVLGYIPEIYTVASEDGLEGNLTACRASGFIITFLAYVSIAHMIFMAVERALTIAYPFHSTKLSDAKASFPAIVIAIWMYGLVWAIMPLIGWTTYELEDDKRKCSINWHDDSVSGRTYIMLVFVFCFVVPGFAMFTSFMIVRNELAKMRDRAGQMFGKEHVASESTRLAESKHAKMVTVMAFIFMLSWTPYAIVSFLVTMKVSVPLILTTLSAYLGKSSTIFNPVIYAFYCASYRKAVRKLFRRNQVDPAESTNVAGSSVAPKSAAH